MGERMKTTRTLSYAGVGARITPQPMLERMRRIARTLSERGWLLRSGGARGADRAFFEGAAEGMRIAYLADWDPASDPNHPEHRVLTAQELRQCAPVAKAAHGAWDRCWPRARRLHSRNAAVVLGPELDDPVDLVLAWTQGGQVRGGTGNTMKIASARNIPVVNLENTSPATVKSIVERLEEGGG